MTSMPRASIVRSARPSKLWPTSRTTSFSNTSVPSRNNWCERPSNPTTQPPRISVRMACSDHLQIVAIGERGERGGRQALVPVGDRGHVALQRQIATVAAPAERLEGHAQRRLEAHGVRYMPAV